jgi:hypothetical protein
MESKFPKAEARVRARARSPHAPELHVNARSYGKPNTLRLDVAQGYPPIISAPFSDAKGATLHLGIEHRDHLAMLPPPRGNEHSVTMTFALLVPS